MKTDWQTHFRLPENPTDTHSGTLASGSSPDAQFIFDVIFSAEQAVFVLTLLHINDELGFIENEKRLYFQNKSDLIQAIEQFMQQPETAFHESQT